MRAKYLRPEVLADVGRVWTGIDDVAGQITPRRQRSWTAAVLHEQTENELDLPFDDIWLPDE